MNENVVSNNGGINIVKTRLCITLCIIYCMTYKLHTQNKTSKELAWF